VSAVDPDPLVRAALTGPASLLSRSSHRVHLVAAGKAAWPMARAACASLGDRVGAGIGTGPRGPGSPPPVEWIEGAHPLPDENSVRAASAALAIASAAAGAGEPLLVLLSGGGSSMLAAPARPVTLADKRLVISALLRAGADIAQLNCVRKQLSAIKGGQLAAVAGGAVTLAISDVHAPEDDPGTIASGPTAGDETTGAQAIEILERYAVPTPRTVRARLEALRDATAAGPLRPWDVRLRRAAFQVIANRRTAMRGAEAEAGRRGFAVHVVDAATAGEARIAGQRFAEMALAARPETARLCAIASGETTVTVSGAGTGGRNQEFVLGAAQAVARGPALTVLVSLGTDGVDGPTDAAGAIVTPSTVARAEALGVGIDAALARNDAYPLLDSLGGLLRWGPTFTNVGDLHLLLTMRP
jgi:glycerate 2-kinase